MNKAKYRVGIYAHCDPDALEKEKHNSLKQQLRTIHSYTDKMKDAVVVREYIEADGSRDDALKEMISDIDEEIINCVVVRQVAVIGRDYHEAVEFAYKFCP